MSCEFSYFSKLVFEASVILRCDKWISVSFYSRQLLFILKISIERSQRLLYTRAFGKKSYPSIETKHSRYDKNVSGQIELI